MGPFAAQAGNPEFVYRLGQKPMGHASQLGVRTEGRPINVSTKVWLFKLVLQDQRRSSDQDPVPS